MPHVRRAGLATCLLIALTGTAHAQCVTAGDPCDDGLFCTVGDTCNAMLACTGATRDCFDGDQCTGDGCDEAAGSCRHPPATAGTSCGDGLFCTDNDRCDGMGRCVAGMPHDCDDGLSCTEDTCNETSNDCDNVHVSDCLIDGVCVVDFASSPANPCMVCITSVATDGYSPAPEGTPCGGETCVAGDHTPAPICDAVGACGVAVASPCGSGVCQDALSCATCADENDCLLGQTCVAGECVSAPDGGVVDDAGSVGVDGGASGLEGGTRLVAHGGGCIACAVTPVSPEQKRPAALTLAALMLVCFARRSRAFTRRR